MSSAFKVVIPARYASTRLPGKPLRELMGKPMLQHVYEAASECNAEEVKYNLTSEGYIKHISKSAPQPLGEALGINLIKKKDLNKFRSELAAVPDGEYFEKALENLTLQKKLKLRPVDVGEHFCREIDFDEDLRAVQSYHRAKHSRQ